MKKLVLLLSLFALTFISCEGPMGPPGKDFDLYNENFIIKSNDWEFIESDQSVSFYKYLIDLDISDYTYNNGLVFVFLYQVDSDNNETQTPVPFSYEYGEGGNKWKERCDFDFDAGTIAFYAEWKKGERPPTRKFRVIIFP